MTRIRRSGLTLVEVLTLIGILALLMGLLLPAIMRVREAANRMVCASRLRAIGQAIGEMTKNNQTYPMGGAAEATLGRTWAFQVIPGGKELPTTREHQNLGWAYQLLPYLGYEAQWKDPDLVAPKQSLPELWSYQRPVNEYYCPTRSRPKWVLRPSYGDVVAAIDYAANGGHLSFSDPVSGKPNLNPSAAYSFPFTATTLPHSGLVGASKSYAHRRTVIDRPLRPVDIRDGLSATLLIGEKRLNYQLAANAGHSLPQPGDMLGFNSGFGTDTIRTGAFPPARDEFTDRIVTDGFGSAHPASLNALFADGSVRPLRYSLDAGKEDSLSIMQRLCHRQDGTAVPSTSFE